MLLTRYTPRNFKCSSISLAIRWQQSLLSYSTKVSIRTLPAVTTWTRREISVARQSEMQQRHNSHYVLSQHSFVKNTNFISRCQMATTSDETAKKGGNTKKSSSDDDEEARLLENIEEIIDVPSSALEEVIDRSIYNDPIPIPMPDLGTSNGNSPDRYSSVKEWFFQTGDIIQHEDVLCDIETPDFTFGMETDDEGITIMGEILVPAGQPVPDGTVLCYTLHESKSIKDQTSEESTTKKDEDDEDEDDDDKDKKEDKKDANEKSESEKSKP